MILLLACAPTGDEPVDEGPPLDTLELPDVSDVDLPAAFAEGLAVALEVRGARAWAGHVAALADVEAGCPDLWVGPPDEDTLEVDTDEGGWSWADHCEGGQGVAFEGAVWWEADALAEGDPATTEGDTVTGLRRLVGDATVAAGEAARFELDGEIEDALTTNTAPDYFRWTWSSTVDATVTGEDALAGASTPGGWRADLYTYATGGDADTLEIRGDVYLFEDRIAGRFDSLSMDLATSPDACEPYGWLSLRDENAYWYDLVFLPRDAEDASDTGSTNTPYDECDGCGTLYLRGVESGEVCPDLSVVWDGRLAPPEIEEFVFSFHSL
ncbi:MAG: hypothetical protein ACOZNI_33780 [Myxococcota bacterium]